MIYSILSLNRTCFCLCFETGYLCVNVGCHGISFVDYGCHRTSSVDYVNDQVVPIFESVLCDESYIFTYVN